MFDEERAVAPPVPGGLAAVVPGLARLWERTTGDRRIAIAVLDGPVDTSHACFAGTELRQVETVAAAGVPGGPASSHGTHVASLLFARPGRGLGGVAPGCRGLLLPVFGDLPGGGVAPCSQLDLARALLRAVELGAQVINVSGGQIEPSGQAHPVLAQAIDRCAAAGVLVVAAAGNDGCDCLHVPAALPPVLAVGACDAVGRPLPSSNWGRAYGHRGLLAPGLDLLGAAPGGGTSRRSGSSYAAAVVSGVAALLASLQCRRGERPDLERIRRALLASAAPCAAAEADERCLRGLLDLNQALRLLNPGGNMEVDATGNGAESVPNEESCRAAEGVRPAHCGCGGSGGGGEWTPPPQQPCRCGGHAPPPTPTSSCACRQGAGGPARPAAAPAAPQTVYALGRLGHDLVSEARRDWFVQRGVRNPEDPADLLAHLGEHPEDAAAVTWTLLQDATPIYALQPVGAFADSAYAVLQELLADQINGGVERISVPGLVIGRATLSNGQVVPLVRPELRGLQGWSTQTLLAAIAAAVGEGAPDPAEAPPAVDVAVFLQRVYAELRNLGTLPSDRAINFAATNALQAEHVFHDALEEGLKLDSIAVERSSVCRPESDCWDVRLTFFDPTRRLERAREVYRFTVDVSDVVPVTVGLPSHWPVY